MTSRTPDARPAAPPQPVDVAAVLRGLDAIFAAHDGPTRAAPYLQEALADAERQGDDGARLTLLNELVGLYRSQSLHDDSVMASRSALTLVESMGLTGTDAHATTLINAATAMRAAGRPDDARALYSQALSVADAAFGPTDRRLAGLHNNLSILCSERQDHAQALAELRAAMSILEASSVDPERDLDIATTCTNLALVSFTLGQHEDAARYVDRSLAIYQDGGHEDDPHYASAVAGHAEACFRVGRYADAVTMYRQALAIITECYGADNDYYAVTAENLAEAEAEAAAAAAAGAAPGTGPSDRPSTATPVTAAAASRPAAAVPTTRTLDSGLDLARAFWEEHGRPMLESRYPAYSGRIAAGLVGHGSECYGFDDAISRDHDTGPGFCLWLTAEDHAEIGAALQADYDALPRTFRGVDRTPTTPRAHGAGRRVGVFEIGAFYEQITGYRQAPTTAHEWLMLDEATLAAATDGAVFADPHGAFSAVRGSFTRMSRDVRWALVSRRLGMISQAGQYNVPRMLDRGDGEAAWLSVGELTRAVASLVFLLTGPSSAGYLPYYKWHFAALRRLSRRMGSSLPGAVDDLSEILRLASAACFGPGSPDARARLEERIERLCATIAAELQARGLSSSGETFLERQREHVAAHITDPWLKAL
ncbi:tetratricopeptide repeat protein [Sanguibacter inulinus]|uniref:DUF4037 domain-containing protein n=1 Tax=Sanguibacter inulinus TaxID=60922 RepID=A0A853EX08_9MICO|nr:tetratricopeptide repeat protein [Sanguibacter inulinus]MBF0722253.1 DUF4037 domain-containing protein [Sanguibacter inulinus]NYS93398.1 DUF4037 domain-containing protein [Sanguibacter inulinus]